MLRFSIALACLISASAVDARRGVNDDGQCVNPCRLAGAEPCLPCPPPAALEGQPLFEALGTYASDVEAYKMEVAEFARTNPEYRNSERYRVVADFISRSQDWALAMRNNYNHANIP